MRTYSVALPLVPLAVGDSVDRSAWVPHVTLIGNVRMPEGASDAAAAVLRRFAAEATPVRAVVGRSARFGPTGSVLVDLLEAPRLERLHGLLLDALERAIDGLRPIQPAQFREGYRPHRAVTAGARPQRGDVVELPTAVLVELEPDGMPGRAVVLARVELGVAPDPDATTEADDVHRVLRALQEGDVRAWVIGGWGVDALVARRTRAHHDLDLFVEAAGTERAVAALELLGFRIGFTWSENRWSTADGRLVPSAFVAIDAAGREIDVHTVEVLAGAVSSRSASVVVLPQGALEATGTIGGRPVPCASVAAQLVMHTGYDLPERQRADVDLLRRLSG